MSDSIENGGREPGLSGTSGSAPALDMTDDPEYQAWVESMAQHCRCTHDCPCAGVLAGGLCDGLTDDDLDSIFDAEDEI